MPMDPVLAAGLRHALGGALGWGAVGAGLGALGAEKGHRGEGALEGGLAGGLTGALTHGLTGAANAHAKVQDRAHAEYRQRAHDDFRQQQDQHYRERQQRYQQQDEARARGRSSAWDDFNSRWGGGAGAGRGYSAPPPRPAHPHSQPMDQHAPWMSGVTTKAEAKAKFRQQARANHPDVGGSTAKMQEINQQWETVQGHPDFQKLAFYFDAGRRAALERFFR